MRDGLAQHNGYEVLQQGDSFWLAFATLQDALGWALQLQSVLPTLKWPPHLVEHPDAAEGYDHEGTLVWRGLRVKIGIHRGAATCRANPMGDRVQYYGIVVRTAAALASTAQVPLPSREW